MIVCVLLVFAFEQFASRGRVLRGVRVAGVELSGFTRAEVLARMSALEAERSRATLRVELHNHGFRLDPRLVGLRVDTERTAALAMDRGRGGGIAHRLLGWIARYAKSSDEAASGKLDRSRLSELIDGWESTAIAERPFDGAVRVQGAEVVAVAPRAGDRVDIDEAEKRLLAALLGRLGEGRVELPTRHVVPPLSTSEVMRTADEARKLVGGAVELTSADGARRLRISAEEIGSLLRIEPARRSLTITVAAPALETWLEPRRADLETAAKNARFVVDARDQISVLPSEPGVQVDRARLSDALLAAARSSARSGELPLTRGPEPSLASEEAEKLGIKKLVRSFTTRHECCQKRVENIHRIADILDGTVVRPGETVSVNTLVGPRTEKNGFVLAPTIEEGEMVDTPGGGVSQFATTLFNALFHGGYEIIERQPHTYWFPRYPMGHEATLSWPKPDIVFRNDTDSGLLIKTSYTETSITVKLYGDNGGRKVAAQVSSRRDITEPPVEFIPNPDLEPDREKVKDAGMIGWSVIVGRIRTFADGTTKEERRKVTYRPRVRRVELHPCRIPEGEPGHTGERCPEPEDVELSPERASSAP